MRLDNIFYNPLIDIFQSIRGLCSLIAINLNLKTNYLYEIPKETDNEFKYF